MLEPAVAFKEALTGIYSSIQIGRYHDATHKALNVTRLAWILKSADELFISEVLGSACIDIDRTIMRHEVPDEDVKNLNGKMAEHTAKLLTAYETQHDASATLKSIRYAATAFQLDAEQRYARRAKRYVGDMG